MKEYLVSGSNFDLENDSVVLRGKRNIAGQEIALRIPVGTLISLAMQTRRAVAGLQAQQTPQAAAGWRLVHPLAVQKASVHAIEDQTIGQCLLVLDPGTDVELQISFQTRELVQGVAEEMLKVADSGTRMSPYKPH